MSELLANLALGFSVAAQSVQHRLLPARRAGRHAGRRAAGHRHGCDRRHAAADHLRPAAGRRADHARRHLLRRAIWRLDHLDPGQYSGRGDLGRHLSRRPSDGAARPRRRGAVDRRHRLVLRRLRLDRAGRRAWRAADLDRAAVRPGGIFLADGARPDLRGGAGQGLGAQGDRHDPHRPVAVDGRLRPRNRRRPHDLRHRRTVRRHRLHQRGDGRVRLCRDHPQPGNVAGKPRHREGQDLRA